MRLEKLRPDQDLQCYFERPTAVAALSGASASGFTVSGCFRQQFDWAVVEWNRDNVFEHPAFRCLPDGDLSGLVLSYEETRENCIPIDSDLYPTIDWPFLRIWTEESGGQGFYRVRLKDYAEPVEGTYKPAEAEFELRGTVTAGDYVGLAWLWEHHTYQVLEGDTLESIVARLAESVNAFSNAMRAVASGNKIRLIYVGPGQTLETSQSGANGNRMGAYGFVAGARTEYWEPWYLQFAGGSSPRKWRITLDFGNLRDELGRSVPTTAVRKMRWTYAADLQHGRFTPCEFRVEVSNWEVRGTGRALRVAGLGSRRIEDDAKEVEYSGEWLSAKGNFSGGSVRYTAQRGAELRCRYELTIPHELYLGVRRADNSPVIEVEVDGRLYTSAALRIPGEDVLVRLPVGQLDAGAHIVCVRHAGPDGAVFYFDFLEAAVPSDELPTFPTESWLGLATDWDTDHSMALAPERTAEMIKRLGMGGRVNHYVGALWFYEIEPAGYEYASATIRFVGTPRFSGITELRIGRAGQPPESDTVIQHLNLIGDTAETIAKAFELEINRGYTAIRAEAEGDVLRIYARAIGASGNEITLTGSPTEGEFRVEISGTRLSGGTDGYWRTALDAMPRLNRAARDWHRSFFQRLNELGLEAVAALSMELQHGDPSEEAGIAQRYPDGSPVLLDTPALQTNFSNRSLGFWRQVYLELAKLMREAGLAPYLQFGEVQWWYFPNASGMAYYDDATRERFRAVYGRDPAIIRNNDTDPEAYPEEAAFLASLLGRFTEEVASYVRQEVPECRFEVLYPADVNAPRFNHAVNLPTTYWNSFKLDSFKTENFTYTMGRDLNKARQGLQTSRQLGFPAHSRFHLVGVSDATAPWLKEARLARTDGVGQVVLFALDQICLVGYALPLGRGLRRALRRR